MLTETQQSLIDEMYTNLLAGKDACLAWRANDYKDYTNARDLSMDRAKAALKAIIREWLETNGITAHIRSELRIHVPLYEPQEWEIWLGATSIYNGKGALPGASHWLNKITVADLQGPRGKMRLRRHKARTDADFLEPTATKFTLLIQDIQDALNSKSPG